MPRGVARAPHRLPEAARALIPPLALRAPDRQALRDLKDPALDELAREKAVQGHALRLMLLFVLVTGGSLLALAVPVGVLWLAERGGMVELEAVLDTTLSATFLIVTTVLGTAVWLLLRRRST